MQRYVLQRKNQIALISGILIVLSFLIHFILGLEFISNALLIMSSIIGLAPILLMAIQALKLKIISIELLVSLAVTGAFFIQNYEESAVVTFLFLFGSYLEQRTIKKTRSAIKELNDLVPNTALRKTEGGYEEVDIEEIFEKDVLLVKTGGRIPVDGYVLVGDVYVDEASITGESLPVSKSVGDYVYAGTILENGTVEITADKVGEDTNFGKIIELVEEAQDSKSDTERFIDKFSKFYTPLVLVLALLVFAITKDVEMAVTILVLGCPGALVIGVPVSNVSGIGNGAKNGILLKGSDVIHRFKDVDTFIFDKTGTLTSGKPEVSDVIVYDFEDNHINLLVSIEAESDHPLAKAIVNYYSNYKTEEVKRTKVLKGLGIKAIIKDDEISVGNPALIQKDGTSFSSDQIKEIERLEKEGNSLVLMSVNKKLSMIIGIKDQIKEDTFEMVKDLRSQGITNLIILSGDNQGAVDIVSKQLGFDKAYGNLLPKDKSDIVSKLQKEEQHIAFVGDGINDSPSLALADIGIAVGSGTDVAIDTSDVVLIGSELQRLPYAYALSKRTVNNMKQNIIIAIGVVLILILSLLFSDWMSMSLGMLVHEGSILVVILNGMRLLKTKKT